MDVKIVDKKNYESGQYIGTIQEKDLETTTEYSYDKVQKKAIDYLHKKEYEQK